MHYFLSFLVALLLTNSSFAEQNEPTKDDGLSFFTWVNYSKTRDWNLYFKELKQVGFNGIILMAEKDGYEKVIPIAQNHGIEVHAWQWVTNRIDIAKEHPEWLDVNARGESLEYKKAYVDYYKFLNPAIPEVRKAIAEKIESIAKIDGLKSISLDYCRYVDAILPTTLWGRYNIKQDKIYPEWDYGYHPEMIRQFQAKHGYNPQELDYPTGDTTWLNFRLEVLNHLVDTLAQVVHKQGKLLSASPFPTPSMSRQMVRQDWSKWPLDIAFPMIYSSFYHGDKQWIVNAVKECRQEMNPDAKLVYGFLANDFRDGTDMTLTLNEAMQNGSEGFSVFTFDSLTKEEKKTLKKIIKTAKRNRAE